VIETNVETLALLADIQAVVNEYKGRLELDYQPEYWYGGITHPAGWKLAICDLGEKQAPITTLTRRMKDLRPVLLAAIRNLLQRLPDEEILAKYKKGLNEPTTASLALVDKHDPPSTIDFDWKETRNAGHTLDSRYSRFFVGVRADRLGIMINEMCARHSRVYPYLIKELGTDKSIFLQAGLEHDRFVLIAYAIDTARHCFLFDKLEPGHVLLQRQNTMYPQGCLHTQLWQPQGSRLWEFAGFHFYNGEYTPPGADREDHFALFRPVEAKDTSVDYFLPYTDRMILERAVSRVEFTNLMHVADQVLALGGPDIDLSEPD
jgi:uncharacterized protein YbdZ (MbtH family)